MPWLPLPMPEGTPEGRADLKKKVRILVDESLGRGVADQLRYEGYNSVFAVDVGLGGKDDSAIVSYAWRENRMIWTHDADFLNDGLVPEHRNPGIVVRPALVGAHRLAFHSRYAASTGPTTTIGFGACQPTSRTR